MTATTREQRPLLVLDCNYLCHAARHAMSDLCAEDGSGSGVVFGFLSRLLSLGEEFGTERFAFCWDSPRSLRREEFPAYKPRRRDLSLEEARALAAAFTQMDALRECVLPTVGWRNVYQVEGLESDDLMMAVAMWQAPRHARVVLVTADADLYQALRGGVEHYDPARRRLTTAQGFVERYGISPSSWVRVKALAGCPGDGVPPVARGVGGKTAIRFLRGELKAESAAVRAIRSPAGLAARRRNLRLVGLPHPATPPLAWEERERPSWSGLAAAAERWELASFLEPEQARRWRALLAGEPLAPRGGGRREPRPARQHRFIHDPRVASARWRGGRGGGSR